MNAPRQRLAARDFKHGGARGNGFDPGQYRQFGLGLAVGLVVALGVWWHAQQQQVALPEADPAAAADAAGQERDAGAGTAAAGEEDPGEQYDFYDMLSNFEVVIAEQERDVRRDQPALKVAQEGVYVLQVGSYRNLPDAERLREKLGKQGIDATIQRVAVDADVWHRVRIGPLRDLARLNALRNELRAADLDPLLIRLGD